MVPSKLRWFCRLLRHSEPIFDSQHFCWVSPEVLTPCLQGMSKMIVKENQSVMNFGGVGGGGVKWGRYS
jgi:hypothetical protein